MNAGLRPSARLVAVALAALAAAATVFPVADASAAPVAPLAPVRTADAPLIDPGAVGPEAVDVLEYDLGDQAFQPEGFPAKVEMKAEVYAPQVISGRAPLVILQHGRHLTCASETEELLDWPCPASIPEIPSYQGYRKLGETLASHGMVVVSVGANGINANDGYLADGGAAARGQLILEHLRRWKAWDASATGSPFGARFVGHIDLADVGLMGHSRGGEGIAAAVQLNQRIGAPFGVKAAFALAPVDFGRRIIGGVELGILLPYCDGDVSDLQGTSYYDDGRYASPGDTTSKMTALLYGANHNFFNTVWTTGPGSSDDADFSFEMAAPASSAPNPCQGGGATRLSAADQEQAGATLMAGFFRRYLQPEPALARFVTGTAPYPASTGPARWSIAFHAPQRLDVESWSTPTTYRVNRAGQIASLVGPTSGLACNPYPHDAEFGEPPPEGVLVMGCPQSTWLAAANDTGVLDAGWVRSGSFVRQPMAPAGTDVTPYDGLRFRVAVLQDSRNRARTAQDFSVVLEDFDGNRASVKASTGTNGLVRLPPSGPQHAVLNGVRLPLAAFGAIDLTRVKAVELRFDQSDAGRLAIADLAFTQEGVGDAAANTVGATPVSSPTPGCRKTSASRWSCALVQLLWGRDATASEIAAISPGYASADRRRQTISYLLAAREANDLVYRQLVETYTQAAVDPEWLNSVLSPSGRRTWEAATVDLIAGFAYASPSLGTSAQMVEATYQTLLGRSADAGGLAYWKPKVEANGPAALARSLLATSGYRGRVVDERYQQVAGRRPDASGRAYWVNRLAAPGGEQALVASLLATEGFRTAAIR